jgi:phosphopantothenoylcysteine synthetase/decarboxylase
MAASLKGKRVAITSGPTRAWIDALRFISNRSTGALGAAIAQKSLREGAAVTFFHGVGSVPPRPHPRLKIVEIETVDDLLRAFRKRLPKDGYDVLFHAMAVLDYVPDRERKGKISSGKKALTLRLVRTPKVINLVKELSPKTVLVGFKLEVGATKAQLAERARRMMKSSRADFVLVNDLRTIEKGRHVGYLLDAEGMFHGPFTGKENIARALVEAVTEKMGKEPRGARKNSDSR